MKKGAPAVSAKKASWTKRYRLGVALNRDMPHLMTLEEVAAELGITKQNAYTETVLALGTFICAIRERLGIPPFLEMVETPEVCDSRAWSLDLER